MPRFSSRRAQKNCRYCAFRLLTAMFQASSPENHPTQDKTLNREILYSLFTLLTRSLPNVAKGKFRANFQISFSKILTNKQHHVNVLAESFHLNGHIIGFHPQTQKLESLHKTRSNTLAVKGLLNLRKIISS